MTIESRLGYACKVCRAEIRWAINKRLALNHSYRQVVEYAATLGFKVSKPTLIAHKRHMRLPVVTHTETCKACRSSVAKAINKRLALGQSYRQIIEYAATRDFKVSKPTMIKHARHLPDDVRARRMAATRFGELSPSWKGDKVGYVAVHERYRQTLPMACAACGRTDAGLLDIALLHDAPDQITRTVYGSERRYSTAPTGAYRRLCRTCHGRYDHGLFAGHRAEGSTSLAPKTDDDQE